MPAAPASRSGGVLRALTPILLIVVLVAAVAGLGSLLGLGPAAMLGALTAMFCLMAAFGGALWPDLKLLAWFAPAVVVAAAAPRLLAHVSVPAAIALVTVVIFVASLLPALGPRFVTTALGLGMAALFGYTFQLTGSTTPWQILAAPVVAVVVTVLVRLLAGMRDPDGPTRAAVANLLTTATLTDPESAVHAWRSDNQRRWLGLVLDATLRYRTASAVLSSRPDAREVLDAASEEARSLAEAIKAKETPTDLVVPQRPSLLKNLPGSTGRLVTRMHEALDSVHAALADRDRTPVSWRKLGNGYLADALAGAISWRSAQFRHALRCALGILVALTLATQRPDDPLMTSFLMAVFLITQPDWRASATRAWERTAGSVIGAVAMFAVLALAPDDLLLPIGLLALVVGFAFQKSQPIVFNACTVLMLVGMYASTKHLDPTSVLVEYLVLTVLAAAIGLLFGFAVVPGTRQPTPAERVTEAVNAVRSSLIAFTTNTAAAHGDRTVRRGRRELVRRINDVLNPPTVGRRASEPERAAVTKAGEALAGLLSGIAGLLVHRSAVPETEETTRDALSALAASLESEDDNESERFAELIDAADPEQRLLFDAMAADLVRLREAQHSLS
ncbi:FUSC family protein [Allokutzneria oryzae]|uniref:FUSC family protein n=1 Tax=Allokutzneria oryzae TaxID=1378989 RepID=A0ABV5ZXN9_9PSEU